MSQFHVNAAPPDPLFALVSAYKQDPSPTKVDLSIGAYRDDNGKPYILPVVRKAEELVKHDSSYNHEYLPMSGLPEFTSAAAKLLFGADATVLAENRVASVQTVSGTGANHIAAVFINTYRPEAYKGEKMVIYVSNPTWANHKAIMNHAGLEVREYRYYDSKTLRLDIDAILHTLETAPAGSAVLLHACAHNPTGIDPTQDEWKKIADVCERRNLFPFFDSAYQGFASGDLEKDAWAVNYFVSRGFEMLVCQSFAKNLGLYGERTGALHVILKDPVVASNVKGQLAKMTRSEISNPPAYGARVAAKILADPELFKQWKDEDLPAMSHRIIKMRKELYQKLVDLKTPGTWNHIVDQIGMFSFTGLSPEQVKRLINEFHVYLAANGRISMAGLNSHNVDYFAKAVHSVVTGQVSAAL
ncbi:hypothetical protein CANCADRAFT_146191 [Tortispora caseinolytica NRRL Y-17796]|uniref:aspartate transaminase n=1 Tax=Tortispora caseinolytica NRRL Y-17796 TaxID=767744 RepID=A0A1E4T9K3_9ASCO|nr:hypothetical protein CANCADRAFT_146191 [Tortispora caseinolytica NRRL Y-17796]